MLQRLDVRGSGIWELLNEPAIRRKVQSTAQSIDRAAQSQGSQTKYDYTEGGNSRPRAAVIAGYERGSTTESSRRVLLRSLDGAG